MTDVGAESGEDALAGEGNVSGFDLGGVTLRQFSRDGVGGKLIRGESEAATGEVFVEEMNAIDFHWPTVSQGSRLRRRKRSKKKPPRPSIADATAMDPDEMFGTI